MLPRRQTATLGALLCTAGGWLAQCQVGASWRCTNAAQHPAGRHSEALSPEHFSVGLARSDSARRSARKNAALYLDAINRPGFVDELAAGVHAGQRLAISRALTLCESTKPEHALQAAQLLRQLVELQWPAQGDPAVQPSPESQPQPHPHRHPQPQAQPQAQSPPPLHPPLHPQPQVPLRPPLHPQPQPPAMRLGISGPPGVGKSTLIEALGCHLADSGHRVAVLAVDPSSAETGGAILGDKTRMGRLSVHPNAYVRPTPARGMLGGVANATYDAMLICEAAGYNTILVETVGVGQSEVAVADLVDCMLLLMPPLGGDDLQAIKRGIMEVADIVAVNKADGPAEPAARRAVAEFAGCLHFMPQRYRGWVPQALAVSAATGLGIPQLAQLLGSFVHALARSGEFSYHRQRRRQSVTWLSTEQQLLRQLRSDPQVERLMSQLLPGIRSGTLTPRSAASQLASAFMRHAR